MFSFEIESQVTWNSLPILPSIFGLSSQNIVIPHYSCHNAFVDVPKCIITLEIFVISMILPIFLKEIYTLI